MGEQLGAETVLAMAQIVDQSLARLRLSTQARTLVELMVIRLSKLEDLDDLPRLIAQLSEGLPLQPAGTPPRRLSPDASAAPGVAAATTNPAGRPNQPTPLPSASLSPGINASPASARAPASPLPESGRDQKKTLDLASHGSAEPQVPPDSPLDADPGKLASVWKQVLAEIGDMTADFAGRAERVAISGPNRLVVHFRKAYTQAQQFCERPDRRLKIEQSLSRLLGKVVRIDFATLPDEAAAAPLAEKAPARPSRRQRTLELQRHPLVRKAAELFDTEIVGVFEPAAAEEGPPAE
jgi:DNA polymerase III gamma/tau subunit